MPSHRDDRNDEQRFSEDPFCPMVTARDPEMLGILLASSRARWRCDPGTRPRRCGGRAKGADWPFSAITSMSTVASINICSWVGSIGHAMRSSSEVPRDLLSLPKDSSGVCARCTPACPGGRGGGTAPIHYNRRVSDDRGAGRRPRALRGFGRRQRTTAYSAPLHVADGA